ncbi:MAG TPA: hypothetical protein VEQ60_10660, partial [Longimicrobium sp.]|nr:hypothetical protein [Longimicrobium sp.]
STPDVQPETGKRSGRFGDAAERRLDSIGAPSLGLPAIRSKKIFKRTFHAEGAEMKGKDAESGSGSLRPFRLPSASSA